MVRRTHVGVLALAGTLSVPVVVAGVAWACGPSGFGVPETPAVPPPSTAAPVAPNAVKAPPANPNPPDSPVTLEIQGGSADARSVVREPSSPSPRTPSQQGAGQQGAVGGNTQGAAGGNTAPSPAAQADINARVAGSTAGVVSQRGQSVFASSAAPRATQKSRGKSKARASATSTTPAVSERAATGDLWGAVTSTGANPSLASAAGPDSGGLSGGVVAAIAMLGLGLAGIAGGALATAGRRRRAAAGTAKR